MTVSRSEASGLRILLRMLFTGFRELNRTKQLVKQWKLLSDGVGRPLQLEVPDGRAVHDDCDAQAFFAAGEVEELRFVSADCAVFALHFIRIGNRLQPDLTAPAIDVGQKRREALAAEAGDD